jgi:hypothetical protein
MLAPIPIKNCFAGVVRPCECLFGRVITDTSKGSDGSSCGHDVAPDDVYAQHVFRIIVASGVGSGVRAHTCAS